MEGQKRRSEKVAAKIFCGVATPPPRKALSVAHAKRAWQKGRSYCAEARLYKADCTIHTTLELRPIFETYLCILSLGSLLSGIFTYLAVSTDLPRTTARGSG